MWLDILRIWSRCKTKSYEICGKRCCIKMAQSNSRISWADVRNWDSWDSWSICWRYFMISQDHFTNNALHILQMCWIAEPLIFRCVKQKNHQVRWTIFEAGDFCQIFCQKSGPKAENGEWWASAAHHRWGQNHPSLEGGARKSDEHPPWTNMEQQLSGDVFISFFFIYLFNYII